MFKRFGSMSFPTVAFIGLLLLPLFAQGTTITIGLLSFDQPVSNTQFTVSNDTGSYSLSPDLPVIDPLTFTNVTIQYFLGNGSSALIGPASVVPGSTSPFGGVAFPAAQNVTEAIIKGTLSTSSFHVDLGSGPQLYSAASPDFTATLLPSSGSSLQGGIDFALLTINASPAAGTVPEPASQSLFALSILLLGSFCAFRGLTARRS